MMEIQWQKVKINKKVFKKKSEKTLKEKRAEKKAKIS